SEVGCEAKPEVFDAAVNRWIANLSPTQVVGVDGEGYSIGATAAFLLDRSDAGWKTGLSGREDVLERLLDPVSPIADPASAGFVNDIGEQISQQNRETGVLVDPAQLALQDADEWHVVIPNSVENSVLQLSGQFWLRQNPQESFLIFA